ncbi:hypothetical protein F9K79_18430 [Ochrobactrum sp. Kaboul]|nr:hypothetical protein F9K79_18430 [Ochrobactrum sp. Kaboul]
MAGIAANFELHFVRFDPDEQNIVDRAAFIRIVVLRAGKVCSFAIGTWRYNWIARQGELRPAKAVCCRGRIFIDVFCLRCGSALRRLRKALGGGTAKAKGQAGEACQNRSFHNMHSASQLRLIDITLSHLCHDDSS